jgi:hypothetical protein
VECTNNGDCGECFVCIDNKCKPKCSSNEECVGGDCVPTITPPGPDADCPDGGWVIDYDCVANKLGVRSYQTTIDTLAARLTALEGEATEPESVE